MIDPIAKQEHYLGLDLIRFAAAIGVALFHLIYFAWNPDLMNESSSIWTVLKLGSEPFRWGWIGVQIFFVISGFVIAFSAQDARIARYFQRRILRLYPTVLICASISAILVFPDGIAGGRYFFTVLIWPLGPFISPVYWTLAVELSFYSVVGVFVWAKWKIEYLGILLLILTGGYFSAKIIATMFGGAIADTILSSDTGVIGKIGLLQYGSLFCVGIFIWSIRYSGPDRRKIVILVGAILCSLAPIASSARYRLATEGGALWHIVEPVGIWLIALAAIMAVVGNNSYVSRKLSPHGKAIRFIGLSTFPLYLVHLDVGTWVMIRTAPVIGALLSLILALILSLIVSGLIVKFEAGIRARLRQAFSDRAKSAKSASSHP